MSDFRETTIGELTVRIDREQCIGSGNCVKVAPEVFELDEEDVVTFREAREAIPAERLTEACDVCPVDALYVLNAAGKQIVPSR